MAHRFGWCQAPQGAQPDHAGCPGVIGGVDGIACSCACHQGALDAYAVEFLGSQVQRLPVCDRRSGNLESAYQMHAGSSLRLNRFPVDVSLGPRCVLRRSQREAVLCLGTLDSQVGKQRQESVRCDDIGRFPVVQRSTACSVRLLAHQRPTEGRLEQLGDIWRDLFQPDPLAVRRLSRVASHTLRVRRPANPNRAVRIHRTSQIRQNL